MALEQVQLLPISLLSMVMWMVVFFLTTLTSPPLAAAANEHLDREKDLSNIRLFSLGTGNAQLYIKEDNVEWGAPG